uniref:Nucleoprotein TPR n=1 Tax=Culicoides sonorensis TaxID=179676 RepID=A0A336LSK8_CULSO
MDNPNIWFNILSETEVNSIPLKIKNKLENYINSKNEEIFTCQALCSAKLNDAERERTLMNNSLSQMKLENEKYVKSLEDLDKLRKEAHSNLTKIQDEYEKLKLELSVSEMQCKSFKKQCETLTNEKDQLSQMVDRRNHELERLQLELHELENKLKDNLNAKCEALIQLDNCSAKEATLDIKSKIYNQEKVLYENQIRSLREDLERSMNELSNIRRESSMKVMSIESKLFEKVEELKITKSINSQLEKANESLALKAEDLTIRIKTDGEETQKLIEHYERELQSQKKLVLLYKDNCDENVKQVEDMTRSIKELQSLLHEATDEYGNLENKLKQMEQNNQTEMQEKDKIIQRLTDDISKLQNLNDELEKSNTENALSSIAPTASTLQKIKPLGLNLTEIYSNYVKTCEELLNQKKDYDKLQLQFKHVLNEIEERAPMLKKYIAERNHLIETNTLLTQQIESIISSNNDANAKLSSLTDKVGFLQRENTNLKSERGDLSRQVCHLLYKLEEIGNQSLLESGNEVTTDMTSNEVITKKLVTFSNIEELQETNTKLLLLVRDLSSKLEEMEESLNSDSNQKFEAKINMYTKKIEEMRNSQEFQTQMIESCMKQRDRYKELYMESLKRTSCSSENDVELVSCTIKKQKDDTQINEVVKNLEDMINQKNQEIEELKQSYEKYKTEKSVNEKIINDQLENMRIELRDQTSKNYKIASVIEFKTEQLKINNKTIEMYKRQIASLEERNKNYEITISRHEISLKTLTEDIVKMQNKLTSTEINLEQLKYENQNLRELEIRYTTEKEFIEKERQNQTLLLQNLETIKTNIQKSEIDGKLKLENSLSELSRESSALRRRLQEEENRFRDTLFNIDSEKCKLAEKLKENEKIILSLKNKVSVLTDEINIKNCDLENLTSKINSLTQLNSDDETQIKNSDLQLKISEQNVELHSLQQEITMIRQHAQQFSQMAENMEKELKESNESFEKKKIMLENEIKHLKINELRLTEKLENMERDLLIQMTKSNQSVTSEKEEIESLKRELADALSTISEAKREASDLKTQFIQVSEELRQAEQKYANEMILHSGDIQAYADLKKEYQNLLEECNNIKLSKESTSIVLSKHQEVLSTLENKYKVEKIQLQEQINDLHSHNSILHDQIETLSAKISIFTNQIDKPVNLEEEQSKSTDELLRIIKFIRKEKDIVISKLELNENCIVRLKAENQLLQKKVEKLEENVNQSSTETQMMIATSIKHEELLRKLDTINAITDSNRMLREERDSLVIRVKDFEEMINKLHNEMFPLKEKDQELSMKLETLTNENASLRIEATRWRQRANLLIERSNKSSPEDIKRLQQEKENLCKLIANEKEECKRLTDELNQNKADKIRLESEISTLKKNNMSLNEEINKNQLDITVFKENIAKLSSEAKDTNQVVQQYKNEIEKLTNELSNKDAQLADTRSKEMQIRKIAKRYKDSYLELQKLQETKTEITDVKANDSNEKNDEVQLLTEENNSLKQLVDELKTSLEKEERNKALLKEAKLRIIGLNESKQNYVKELQQLKSKLAFIEQNKSDLISAQNTESETLALKTKENEELVGKINQLTRQIALQSVKPMPASTSGEKNTNETVRTANVRPITPTTQHSTSVTMWRGNETPLASIRPMTVQGGRSNSITSNQVLGIPLEAAASTTLNLDTVNNNQCGTSSTIIATVPPLGSAAVEQTHEVNNEQFIPDDINSFQNASVISQTVALVSPRVEIVQGVDTSQQGSIDLEHNNVNIDTELETPSSLINMQPASSSVPVSTSHLKRSRETDSVNILDTPLTKKNRSISLDNEKKASNKFINEIEYQVPTSSQRDQDDEVIEIDDEREAVVGLENKQITLKDTYSEEQSSADITSADPEKLNNLKPEVSSAHQESKASSSDTVSKPSSSEIWFNDKKDVTEDNHNVFLHTTTTNQFEEPVITPIPDEHILNSNEQNINLQSTKNDSLDLPNVE